jgi:HrpA-like RNA helicase
MALSSKKLISRMFLPVLQILVLDLGEPSDFLRNAVDPPTDLAIKNALNLLESLGAVECNWDVNQDQSAAQEHDEGLNVLTSLTALGYHLATLPVHPRVGKMMIYGALFGVYDSCLTMAAAMTSRSPFISSFEMRDAADEAKRTFASDDHISVLLAFNQWRYLRQRDGRRARAFLRDNFLSFTVLNNIIQLRRQLIKYMFDIGFPSPTGESSGLILLDSNEMHLVRAVVAAGLYPNIIVAPKTFGGKTSAGEVAFRGQRGDVYLHPCTIAFSSKELDSRYCCYHEIVKTSKVYVRDCTTVSKFAILLFGGALKVYQSHGVASVDDWLKFRIQAKPATLVKYLRNAMETLLLEKIMNPEVDVNGSQKGRAVIDAVSALLKLESVQC